MTDTKDTSALKRFLPHLGILVLFVALSLAYCYPLLQGKVILQSDIIQSLGMQTEIHEFAEKTGETPLWTNSMFSGMPAYQIWNDYPKVLVGNIIHALLGLLPHPADVLFMYLLFTYLTFLLLGFNKWQALLGAIAYAFMSANMLYLEAGHYGKTIAMAFMPLVVGSAIITLRGRWQLGAAIFALIFSMQIRANHVQIVYYTGMFVGLIWLAYLVMAAMEKQLPYFAKATGALMVAGLLGVAVNTSLLWSTYEYSKDTIRGGSELAADAADAGEGGLDLDYALRWSNSPAETFTLLIPNFYGGSSNKNIGTNSITYETIVGKGVPPKQAENFVQNAPMYHGDQPFTGGPFYFGAIICFLFVFGLLTVKGPLRWAVIGFMAIALPLSWGRNFLVLTELFFDYFPLYNKFRDVKMILIAFELGVVLLALTGLKVALDKEAPIADLKKKLYIAAGITGGLSLLIALFGGSFMSFEGPQDGQYAQQGQWLIEAFKADRARLLRNDSFRSLFFILLGSGVVWAYLTEKMRAQQLLLGLSALVLVDLWTVDQRFFDADDYITQKEYDRYTTPDGIDLAIKQDTDPHYRVLNLSVNTFNDAFTSYHHKSVGGYHAAKLSRYQDMIERHIGQNNRAVWNMLNTKYIITRDENQPGGKGVIKNTDALGNAWFVSGFQMVDGAEAEISALNGFNPSKTAVVDNKYADYVTGIQPSANGSTITLTDYHPNHLTYEANVTGGEQFAVFSEVYYNSGKGWKAYIDDQPVEHIRVNYILRGLKVPAGKHTIRFDFEPQKYYMGENISLAASLLVFLLLGGGVFLEYKRVKEEKAA